VKIAALIARLLLGLIFFVFGLNHFWPFIPMGPMPTGPAGQFIGALITTGYMYVVAFFEVAPAILLLINRFVPLGLTLLAPVIFNILLVGVFLSHQALGMGAFVTILWFLVFFRNRSAFAGLFEQRVQA
jgi:putative oxidoreductase